MKPSPAIVNPVRTPHSPCLESGAVMVGPSGDLQALCRRLRYDRRNSRPLFGSRIYSQAKPPAGPCVVGPLIGAPYAVMLMETLIAWGARRILFWGWCGSIHPDVNIGDVIVPDGAYIDEGTSRHYAGRADTVSHPSAALNGLLKAALQRRGVSFHPGTVWSTDAIFRETPDKVLRHQRNGRLAVEMEASALFSVASFRRVEVGAVLIVSDELSTLQWQPGFKTPAFIQSRQAICEVIAELCPQL